MLTALIDLTSTGEFEDNGFLCISHASHAGQHLLLRLNVRLPEGEQVERAVLCRQPRSHRIWAAEIAETLMVSQDHVLIWPHSQPEVELYFNGRVQDSRALLGALFSNHYRLLGEWFAFSHFMNSALFSRTVDLLGGGHGLLAQGPEPVIAAYRAVLAEFGIRHSSPPARQPSWWDGTTWQIEQELLHVLIIGQSYVVAPEFRETTA